MKKLLLLALVAVFTTACEDCDCTGDDLRMYSQEVNSPQNAWALITDNYGENGYYSTTRAIPQLTREVCEIGTVNAYMYTEDDVQVALPYVRHYENEYGDKWTETIWFDYSQGEVYFYVSYSHLEYFPSFEPGNFYFRVVMTW